MFIFLGASWCFPFSQHLHIHLALRIWTSPPSTIRSQVYIAQPSAALRMLSFDQHDNRYRLGSNLCSLLVQVLHIFFGFSRKGQADQNPPQLHSTVSAHLSASFSSGSYPIWLAHSFHASKSLSTDCQMQFWKLESIIPQKSIIYFQVWKPFQ